MVCIPRLSLLVKVTTHDIFCVAMMIRKTLLINHIVQTSYVGLKKNVVFPPSEGILSYEKQAGIPRLILLVKVTTHDIFVCSSDDKEDTFYQSSSTNIICWA